MYSLRFSTTEKRLEKNNAKKYKLSRTFKSGSWQVHCQSEAAVVAQSDSRTSIDVEEAAPENFPEVRRYFLIFSSHVLLAAVAAAIGVFESMH